MTGHLLIPLLRNFAFYSCNKMKYISWNITCVIWRVDIYNQSFQFKVIPKRTKVAGPSLGYSCLSVFMHVYYSLTIVIIIIKLLAYCQHVAFGAKVIKLLNCYFIKGTVLMLLNADTLKIPLNMTSISSTSLWLS